MLILALESAASACETCVWQDGQTLAVRRETMTRGQDARLLPLIEATLAEAKKSFADLDRIAVTRGPGSFTGLRVGLAAAQGLGLALDRPVLGLNRFDLYRVAQNAPGEALVILDSKREDLFCRFYPANAAPQDPTLMTQEAIEGFLAAHPDCAQLGDRNAPDLIVTPTLALLAAQADPARPEFLPRPLYLRAPDVTFPKNKSEIPPDAAAHPETI